MKYVHLIDDLPLVMMEIIKNQHQDGCYMFITCDQHHLTTVFNLCGSIIIDHNILVRHVRHGYIETNLCGTLRFYCSGSLEDQLRGLRITNTYIDNSIYDIKPETLEQLRQEELKYEYEQNKTTTIFYRRWYRQIRWFFKKWRDSLA